jgi:predicted DNA-binding transcriptional regulator AlpA
MLDDTVLDDHGARRRARVDILLLFHELAWQDQYKTYKVIQGFFIHSGKGAEAWEELRARAECVRAVQRVAKHLRLPAGEMPGVKEYERTRKELGLELGAWTIERRWRSWPEVCKAARGERVKMTARQRAQVQVLRKDRLKGEEWLAGVREWLASRPPSLYSSDYDAWAEERNEEKPKLPPVRTAGTIHAALGLSWRETVRVARRDLSLAEAHARRLKVLRREGRGFVSIIGVALIRGLTMSMAKYYVETDRTFPAHAFKLHTARVWRWEDVEAHHQGRPFPRRRRGEMQHEVFDSDDIVRLCGLTQKELYAAIRRRSPQVPRPAGRISSYSYWLRAEVEAWSEQRRAA